MNKKVEVPQQELPQMHMLKTRNFRLDKMNKWHGTHQQNYTILQESSLAQIQKDNKDFSTKKRTAHSYPP